MNHKQRRKRNQQRARRRANNWGVSEQNKLFDMIDGNRTYYPYAYCRYRKGYLTKSLAITHRCEERQCQHFEIIFERGKTNA